MEKLKKDLTGIKFGRWTVLYQCEKDNSASASQIIKWHCRCECGQERDVNHYNLIYFLFKYFFVSIISKHNTLIIPNE